MHWEYRDAPPNFSASNGRLKNSVTCRGLQCTIALAQSAFLKCLMCS